ncbi:MAG TPA: DUF308 domain-containing protein [Puia sp.]
MSTILGTLSTDIKNWWWFIVKGLLLIIAGIAIFSKPLEGYVGLSVLFSLVILGAGFAQIFFASSNRDVLKGWGWTLASGILDVVIGIYLLTFPLVTMATLPFILGFWLIFRSFYLVGMAFDLKSWGVADWGWLLFGGIVSTILGFFVLYYPGAGAVSIIYVSGSAFVVAGVFNLYLSAKLKGVKDDVKSVKEKLQHG